MQTGFSVMHAPTSVVGSAVSAIYRPSPRPACGLSDVLPVRTVVLAALLLYVSLTTNFITFSGSLTRIIMTHAYIRVGLIFLLSFFMIDYGGPFRLLPRIATAALITLIYQIVIGLADEPSNCVVVKTATAVAGPGPGPGRPRRPSPSSSVH